ncbi:MAG: isoleucine--tRNA ligase [Gulosibacter sp.]|uniref:isoleucine--tRNA ligase n=1 Tax=Gulosibacter sp. TaxID=2817531 RepID=UPI003F90C277
MSYPKSAFGPGAESVPASPSFPNLESQVLEFWRQDNTFQESIDQREGAEEWVFYDGPPFANGLPHYGHLLTGYAKDVFPRYNTMRGKQVNRVFGWDTHGLPAELEAMKQLGISTKEEIEEMGIGNFNAAAKDSVLRYTKEWREYVERQGRWVDFENGYRTLDINYMESVIWAFKNLYDQGLAYEGFRVLPYCWNDETPLSNHELRMDDDVYQMRQDNTVTVTFPLVGEKADALGLTDVRALAWTTTPWTLPTNLALAVGPEVTYSVIPAGPLGAADGQGAANYLLASDRIAGYVKELGYPGLEDAQAAVKRTLTGAELEGVRYVALWDFYADTDAYGTENAWQILVADYVTTSDGTGIVHQAPAYGEEDKNSCDAAGIPTILSVDAGGRFLDTISPVAGEQIFDANRTLVQELKNGGRLLQQKSYEHSYPHCWRCKQPLMYKAVSSWFVKVTDYREEMIEHNEQIEWVPENVKYGQFGKWLEGARDWSISRNRYWGSPIPVWKSDDPNYPRVDVYGSLDELERDFGVRPTDLHRPAIDELTRPNPDDPTGKSTMRRIEDVLDVWFDSGSMPFAQVHYPFENRDWFDSHSPADFIVEYIGQTRGWFYVMHALSTPLFHRPAYKRVVSHGIVLGSDGRKMSKSLQNYPDVNEVFDRDGSDAMRWFLLSSSVLRGGNLVVTEEGIRESTRQFLLPLWSTYYFFTTYAISANGPGNDGYTAQFRTDSTHLLDRYILAKLRETVEAVTNDLDSLDASNATARLRDFADVLTNWYVRRSRDRFWVGTTDATGQASIEGREAFDTLYTVLETLCRLAAPLAPFTTETVWRGLTGARSVHLADYPATADYPADEQLVRSMDAVREIVSAGQGLRKQHHLRVRLPLGNLTVLTTDAAALEPFASIIADELNVREVSIAERTEEAASEYGVSRVLRVNARAAGPRLGKQVQQVIKAAKSGDWQEEDSKVVAGGIALEPSEYELDLKIREEQGTDVLGLLPGGGILVLNTEITPELAAEGAARDVIRAVQDARKAAQLDVSDRIHLELATDDASLAALQSQAELIAGETLAMKIAIAGGIAPEAERSTIPHSYGALDIKLERVQL